MSTTYECLLVFDLISVILGSGEQISATFHVEQVLAASHPGLAEDNEFAVKRINQGVCRHPGQRWRRRVFQLALARSTKKQQLPACSEKGLECKKRTRLDSDGTN